MLHRHPLFAVALTAGLLATAPACSDEPSVTADEFVAQYPKTFCAYAQRCCSSSERSGSTGQCEARVKRQLSEDLLDFRTTAGAKVSFNGDAAQACLDKLAGACDTTLAAGCMLDAVTPGQSEGQDCSYSAECQSLYCVQPQKHAKGSCGGSGTGCSDLDISCSSGAYCGGRQCLAKKQDGDPCSRPGECASGICAAGFNQCGSTVKNLCDGQ